MILFLTGLWTKFQGYIVVTGIVLAGIVGIYAKGVADAKAKAKQSETEQRLKDLKKAKEIDDKVDQMDDGDLERELDKWMRD